MMRFVERLVYKTVVIKLRINSQSNVDSDPGKRGTVLVETALDAVYNGDCKCEGILNPSSHAKKKNNW